LPPEPGPVALIQRGPVDKISDTSLTVKSKDGLHRELPGGGRRHQGWIRALGR
jgi:hypothetical protein